MKLESAALPDALDEPSVPGRRLAVTDVRTIALVLAAALFAFALGSLASLAPKQQAVAGALALVCVAVALTLGRSRPSTQGTVGAQAAQQHLAMVQQLQAILANASVGIMITRNGRFELVGQHLCLMFGYTERELMAQPTAAIYQSDAAYVELGPRMRADLTAHGRFDGELVMRRKNGKEFWVHMLGRAVIPGDSGGGTIWILEDISQAREAHDKLSWTATHDNLTGLVNRKEFEARMDQSMSQFKQHNVCVMFIDLDKFKSVNDNAGHAAGDEVLRSVAALFETAVRQSDTVARLGGDEFAILLPGCPLDRAQAIAEHARAAVEGYQLVVDGQTFTVGTSIGLVEVNPDMPTVAAVLHAADGACYAAKRGGRNRVVTHIPDAVMDAMPSDPEPVTAT